MKSFCKINQCWLTCLSMLLCGFFSSCHYDPYYYQERQIRNQLPDSIVVITTEENVVEPETVRTIDSKNHFVEIKESYDESDYIDWPITIRFNDTVSIQYTLQDTFAKSTCYMRCYEIDNYYWKSRNKQQRITYTIDEQDYYNALVKCGYLSE